MLGVAVSLPSAAGGSPRKRGEMKAKGGGGGGGGPGPEGPGLEDTEDAPLPCRNCRRGVSSRNLPLHEAHCLRFLALCPECQEPVPRRTMEDHLRRDHRQVRCQLCHRAMQKYQLQEHTAEECPERRATCGFCELALPFHRLGAHLEACGSRTTRCWDCGRYVMFRALEGHSRECQGSSPPPGAKASFCQQCQRWVPEERRLQHMDECCPLPQLLGALSTRCPPGPGSPPAPSLCSPPTEEKGARPKRKDKDLPPMVGKPSLKPPRSKKGLARLAFTATTVAPPPLTPAPEEGKEGGASVASAYDSLATCPHCHILLPSPTLQSHQKKCQQQAQRRRRSPRFLDKGEEPQMQSPPGENSWQ